jgi:subtilisin family serine protease
MSWGGGGSSNYGLNIVNAAFNAGSILVAAAGNDGTNQQFFPAAYNNVIAVASTTTNDAKSNFSQYGTWITISAPGSAIRSTWASSNTAYNRIQGTSMASPNVAGLVGLMKSYGPNASNQDIINCLLNSADDISAVNPSFNGQLGSGRINAFAA